MSCLNCISSICGCLLGLKNPFRNRIQSERNGQNEHEMDAIQDLELQKQLLLEDIQKVQTENEILENKKKLWQEQQALLEEEQCSLTQNEALPKILGKFDLSEVNWPDPDPEIRKDQKLLLDDVTRMNPTEVDRIFFVRSAEDVKHVLRLARLRGKSVSFRGTKHSMGGHTLAENGFVIGKNCSFL